MWRLITSLQVMITKFYNVLMVLSFSFLTLQYFVLVCSTLRLNHSGYF